MQPLDEGIDISRVKEAIACNKDIDGQTEKSMNGVFSFRKNALAPATALAVGLFRGRGCERSELPCLACDGDI